MVVKNKKLSTNGRVPHVDSAPEGEGGKAAPVAVGNMAFTIPKPVIHNLRFRIRGLSPLLVCAFNKKVAQEISNKMEGKAKNKKAPKDPDAEWQEGKHISEEGWEGIHCGSFRGAIIDAARSVDGITMTALKQAVFVVAEGRSVDGAPLIRIHGKSEKHFAMCRTQTGVAYPRYRPIYKEWECDLIVRANGHILTPEAAANLVALAGATCGVGEWRPTSPKSKTGEFGLFEIIE